MPSSSPKGGDRLRTDTVEAKGEAMASENGRGLFGGGDPRGVDPRILLLDEVLGNLSQEEQIKLIAQVLLREEVWSSSNGKGAIALVEALEKLFDENRVAFRIKLMELCNAIPMQIEGDRHYNEQLGVAVDLRLAMLGKIIQGWSWKRQYGIGSYAEEEPHLLEDAETCFQVLCDSYRRLPWYQSEGKDRIRKGILQLLRDHLEPSGELKGNVGDWRAYDLNPWILAEETPSEIVLVLIKARTHLEGLGLRKEIKFLEECRFHRRSGSAVELASNYVRQIREIDELVWKVVERVRPRNRRGDPNPSTPLRYEDDIRWGLKTPEQAWVTIVFRNQPNQKAIAQVREIRDQVLAKISEDKRPRILIEAEGPKDFSYKEE